MTHDFSSNSTAREDEASLVVAESPSFAAFDQWIDEQLAQLVARWVHLAAPNADRAEFLSERFSS